MGVGALALVALAFGPVGGLQAAAQDQGAAPASQPSDATANGSVGSINYPEGGVLAKVNIVPPPGPAGTNLEIPRSEQGKVWLKAIEDTKNFGGTVTVIYNPDNHMVRDVTRN